MWRQADAMCLGEGGDLSRGRQAAAMRNIRLDDLAAPCGEQVPELSEVGQPLARRNRRGYRRVDMAERLEFLRPAGLLEKKQAVWLERLGEQQPHRGRRPG